MTLEITEKVARKVLSVVDKGLSSGLGERKPGEMCVEAAVCYALGLPHGDDPRCVSPALRQLKINLNDRPWSSKVARAKGLRRLAVAQLGSLDHLDDKEFAKRVAELAIRKSVPEALRSAASLHKDPKHVRALRDAANTCEREPTESNSRETRKTAADAAYAAAAAAANAAAKAAYAAATYAHNAAHNAANAAYVDAADDAANAAANAAYAAAANAHNAAYAAYVDAADDAANAAANAAAYAHNAANVRDKSLADFAEGVVQILIAMDAPGCQWLILTEAA